MALEALERQLRAGIANGRLALSSASTGIEALDSVLGPIAEQGALRIEGVEIARGDTKLTVAGNASFLNVPRMPIEATFVMAADRIEMSMVARVDRPWSFAQSFPDLPDYADFAPGRLGMQPSFFYALDVREPRFIVSTYAYRHEQFDIVAGINLTGALSLEGPLEFVGALFGKLTPAFCGSIDLNAARPVLSLTARVPIAATVGPLTMDAVELTFFSRRDDASGQFVSGIALACATTIGREVEMALSAELAIGADVLALHGEFADLKLPGLGDLADLAGGEDLGENLPAGLQDLTGFFIDRFELVLSPRARTLDQFAIALRNPATWTIVDGVLDFGGIEFEVLVQHPFDPEQRWVEATVFGQLELGGGTIVIAAQLPDFAIEGTLREDETIKAGALIKRVAPAAPLPDDALAISVFDISASPKYKTYRIEAQIDQVWSLELDFGTFAIASLYLLIDYAPPNVALEFDGELTLLDKQFLISAQKPDGDSWIFSGRLAEGDTIHLPELVQGVLGETIDLSHAHDLADMVISELEFSVDTGDSKAYRFSGAFDWQVAMEDIAFTVAATLEIHSWLDGPIRRREGRIGGAVAFTDIEVDFFDNFTIAAIYHLKPGASTVAFEFKKGEFVLNAAFDESPAKTISVQFGSQTTFGSLLTLLAQIADPDIEEFSLDSPWDELNTLELSGLSLKIDLATQELAVVYAVDQSFFDGLVRIGRLGLKVTKRRGKTRLMIDVDASVLGERLPEWDALNERPPTVPGKGNAIFDLAYLGLGQHVALTGAAELNTITDVINAMRRDVVMPERGHANPLAKRGAVAFDASSGWLIGAQFKVLDTVALSAIFNDPLIYGMRVEVSGPRAPQFKGLVFEILYRRISDTTGVYHIELVLPDAMRQIQVGVASLTLPVVVLDIYSNGDFKIDLGFPWNGDFERSFSINVLIFMGVGGFYFNKLSAATATSVPKITPEIGTFNPVIEFGLGLKVGLGRTFNKGPLKAELSVTLQGVVQGVFSWFHPNQPGVEPDQYYMVKGGVAIVGRVWGRVDFEVIQVEVEVIARAMVVFKIESYRVTPVTLSATVSVRASVTVVFIEIHFKFDLTITESFLLGSDTEAPWERRLPRVAAMRLREMARPRLRWQPIEVWEERQQISIYFLPAIARSDAGMHGVALLFIPNAIPTGATANGTPGAPTDAGFDLLAQALFRWAIQSLSLDPTGITLGDLDLLYRRITSQPADDDAPLDFENLAAFLEKNFTFHLNSPADSISMISATVFPMFPNLVLTPDSGDSVDFWTHHRLSASDRQRFARYFNAFSSSTAADRAASKSADSSATIFIFVDYFALIVRSTVQYALDVMRDRSAAADELDRHAQVLGEPESVDQRRATSDFEQRARELRTITYEDLLVELTGEFRNLAGIVSRFMLHGIRLPWPDGQPGASTPLYAITGQQFDLPDDTAAATTVTLAHSDSPGDVTLPQIRLGAGQTAMTRPIGANLLALFNSLRDTKPLGPPQPTPLPFYTSVPRHFNLQHVTSWQSTLTDGPAQMLDLPEPLRAYLSARGADGGALELKILRSGPSGGSLGRDDVRSFDVHPWTWAARVAVNVRRIATSTGLLDRTYRLAGMNPADEARVAEIWQSLRQHATQPRLYLLYRGPDGGLLDQVPTASLLLKTNLATATHPAANVSAADASYCATLDQGSDFVRLLWESSIVDSGGYYLHYQANGAGLPAQVFADGLAGIVELLILLDEPDMTSRKVARRFDNCLVIGGRIDLGSDALFAEADDAVMVQHVPAGHLGFHLERLKPAPGDHLGELYQLLSYRLQEGATFMASKEGLPIGPTSESDRADRWGYERVLPLFRFAKDKVITNGTKGLPDAAQNPYAGIRRAPDPAAALPEVAIEFQWQDVYGNRFDDRWAQTVPVRYVDALAGINQWPSVAESYSFAAIVGDDDHVLLTIELAFDHSAYRTVERIAAQNLLDKVSATRVAYERIYYQIHQPDVSFTVTNTVLPGTRYTFSSDQKKRLTDFVDSVYRYLGDLELRLQTFDLIDTALPIPIRAAVPITLAKTALGHSPYPPEIIFPVAVQVDMARDPVLCDTMQGGAVVQRTTSVLKASTAATGAGPATDTASEIASLRAFAAAFQDAFGGLHLAAGEISQRSFTAGTDTPDDPAPRQLWAVQIGAGGIRYDIHEALPFFFSPAPLANTLLSGSVAVDNYSSEGGLETAQPNQRRIEAIDLDVLARDFLTAVEAFLDPSIAVPAAQRARSKPKVDAILTHKRLLAEAIARQVTPILAQTDQTDISVRRQIAADSLRQQLLINLAEAYDIETVIQYHIDVTLAPGRTLGGAYAPRLFGQPVAQQVKHTASGSQVDAPLLNFSLSPAKISLTPGQSYLTFFFNTRTPEKFEDLTLNLAYRANEIEHDIADIPGIPGYQSSSWLSFILPLDPGDTQGAIPPDSPNAIGDTPIPIPLRSYPMPPSLVLHAAEADPDSLQRLEDIRQWQYTYVYEHPDIAQDTIETAVTFNALGSANTVIQDSQDPVQTTAEGNVPPGLRDLFNELVNFSMIYPRLAPQLQWLAEADHSGHDDAIDRAIAVLEQLVGRVSEAWGKLQRDSAATGLAPSVQYEIDEVATETTREVTITTTVQNPLPILEVPGFAMQASRTTAPPHDGRNQRAVIYTFTKKTPEDPVYGESSIPDRKLTIQNLDLIEQQNGWGAIWLTRNKRLLAGWQTNPAFIYQTPQVRFANMVTPLRVSSHAWSIDRIGAPAAPIPQPRSLADHIQRLLVTLLPEQAGQAYDFRVNCQYAFALVVGDGDDLIATLPVLLGPRFTVSAGAPMLNATAEFRASLVAAIQAWQRQHEPARSKAMFVFSITIFSHLGGTDQQQGDNLPLLRIENLRLGLESILPESIASFHET